MEKKNRNFTKFSSQAISRLRGSDRVSCIFTFATNTRWNEDPEQKVVRNSGREPALKSGA